MKMSYADIGKGQDCCRHYSSVMFWGEESFPLLSPLSIYEFGGAMFLD
jgi:hypothetical protein